MSWQSNCSDTSFRNRCYVVHVSEEYVSISAGSLLLRGVTVELRQLTAMLNTEIPL